MTPDAQRARGGGGGLRAHAREAAAGRRPPPPRLALRIEEAADSLGVSVDTFERHIAPGVRVVYVGRLRLYPVAELARWAERAAVAPVSETGGGA